MRKILLDGVTYYPVVQSIFKEYGDCLMDSDYYMSKDGVVIFPDRLVLPARELKGHYDNTNWSGYTAVLCTDTGVIYNTTREAEEKLGLAKGSVRRVTCGTRERAGGHSFLRVFLDKKHPTTGNHFMINPDLAYYPGRRAVIIDDILDPLYNAYKPYLCTSGAKGAAEKLGCSEGHIRRALSTNGEVDGHRLYHADEIFRFMAD